MNIKWVGCHPNNYDVGRSGKKINKIVVHWIVGTLESCDTTFANPDREASTHYAIGDSDIHQYVKEEDTAWHASNLTVNRESIGIEHEGGWLLEGGTRKKPTDLTHQTSAKLVADICRRYSLPINRDTVHGHNEYKATQCPGSLDIDRIIELARKEVTPDPVEISDPQAKLVLGLPWGVQELQATISILNDQKRALENCQSANSGLETAYKSEITKLNENWQKKLGTANGTADTLRKDLNSCIIRKAENLGWSELFSIAWKKWWSWKKNV